MKYAQQEMDLTREQRKALNEKVLYLIDSNSAEQAGITSEDIYNAYTGEGGLHGLERADFDSYHAYSEKKKEIENGQFFTPPAICQLVAESLRPSISDVVADLTCGKGSFFNFMPVETNCYGCELDARAYKVAHYLYPGARLELTDIRAYKPDLRFDYVVGNPPFNLKWYAEDGECLSQLYYCVKAAQVLKPLGILALVTPCSFLADDFADKAMIHEMEARFSFLGQIALPEDAFSTLGVASFPTKLQFWQKKSDLKDWTARRYTTSVLYTLAAGFDPGDETKRLYEQVLMFPKSELEKNRSHVLLELARMKQTSAGFSYETQKLLYQIKAHPAVRDRYTKCCEYLHRFYTEQKPDNMDYKEWDRKKLTEAKVLTYLRRTLRRQNRKPPQDVAKLVKQNDQFVYKAYSAKAKQLIPPGWSHPVSINDAVLDNTPERFLGFERLIRRKRREYENQSQPFADMEEDPFIAEWLEEFTLWDDENEEVVQLNDIQRHDINLILQKRYGLLQWEQGSGKTLAAIAVGTYRMEQQHLHSTWVVSSAISIRNNWDVVLKNYGLPYVFVERLKDFDRIRPGVFVIMTLNKMGDFRRHIKKWLKLNGRKIQFVFDESDEISNPSSILVTLENCMEDAFPELPDVDVQVKYVQKSMEEYLSPAFYMIPPIDNSTENVIYINQGRMPDDLTLFTTLAHEGYPGHLYQTVYYQSLNPDPIRSLLNFGGYTEGWATYCEMISYYYSPLSKEMATLMQKNSSLILGLYALADIGIHYTGWSLAETITFFGSYGITDTDTIQDIYQLIVADPANYLKYYIGYVEFLKLKKNAIETWGDDFSQKRFHQEVLEIGPASFNTLKHYIGDGEFSKIPRPQCN